ncbi:helix-turn-helix domain-containing protein [Halocynthiibacter namhaensis]|uniref:helix-turn-helix domain-containing protein n=1 Tax=Halocynthiibacter namhaensis TaxID=1290553 RepID=UPI000690A8D3|nr:helix-turn-helix domain-containing protein [Halocynthiibacter namhaensis]
MSHKATNWAIQQRGLKPSTKIILWFLSDCHNSHTGRCDPCQATLAEECEMSRSTVNLHLADLEKRGLIRRIQRSNAATKTKKSTLYILALDDEKPQNVEKAVSENRTRDSGKAVSEKTAKPCPKKGRSRVRPIGHKPVKNLERTSAGAREGVQKASNIACFWAEKINSGKSITGSAINAGLAREMIAAGLVTEEQLRKLRVTF